MSGLSLIDTHCHLNFDHYRSDFDEVMGRAAANGVERVIVPATDLKSCGPIIQLAESWSGIYAAVGIHPNSADDFDGARLREWAAHERVIAIGEIGLDYYWDKRPRSIQRRVFEQQLDLAGELELPVIIHSREAGEDVLAALTAWLPSLSASLRGRPGVLHSFSDSSVIAERALSLGFYLGFTGPITFKKAKDLRTLAKGLPRDRLLIETDGPFLTPHPRRGRRNEPAYARYVNQKLAELHGLSEVEMGRQTTANAECLFGLSSRIVQNRGTAS